jgi:hypothetical protein
LELSNTELSTVTIWRVSYRLRGGVFKHGDNATFTFTYDKVQPKRSVYMPQYRMWEWRYCSTPLILNFGARGKCVVTAPVVLACVCTLAYITTHTHTHTQCIPVHSFQIMRHAWNSAVTAHIWNRTHFTVNISSQFMPAGPTTNTARLSSRYEGKTRGCYCSRWAPDAGGEHARNMLSCKQTSG